MKSETKNSTDTVASSNVNNTADEPTPISQIKDALIIFLPEPLKQIFTKGLFKVFLILLSVFMLLPPSIVLLTALWMKLLGNVENTAIKGIRNAYLEIIYDGFSIESVDSSHLRLDYLQLFNFDLRPRGSPRKDFIITIQPGQKAEIEAKVEFIVDPKIDKATCTLSEDDIDLVSVYLGEIPLKKTLKNKINKYISIDKGWWDENSANFESSERSSARLSFKLSAPANNLPCGSIHIEGNINVFKSLLTKSIE